MTAHELLDADPPESALILGTDEAGYGPNLGPLLVGATCWSAALMGDGEAVRDAFLSVEDAASHGPEALRAPKPSAKKRRAAHETPLLDLCALDAPTHATNARDATDDVITRFNAALEPVSAPNGLFPLVDSKRLYAGSKSIDKLERSFFVAAALLNLEIASFQDVARMIATEPENRDQPPWERDAALKLPLAPKTNATKRPISAAIDTVRSLLTRERIELLAARARRVQPRSFNAMLERPMLKSDLIADVTTATLVETLRDVLRDQTDVRVPCYAIALCDKLGGRDRYLEILRARFPDATIAIVQESRAASVYRIVARYALDREGDSIEFNRPIALETRFTAKGEANAPTALASIVAKYLRELSMTIFNDFWKRATGDEKLEPTAGYPVDAIRFRADVETTRRALEIPLEDFWRNK